MTDKEATAYLVLTPKWNQYFKEDDGTARLQDIRISRITAKRPGTIKGDELVMKVRVRVPSRAFKPLSPEVVIDVPENLLMTGEAIMASAEDPGGDE